VLIAMAFPPGNACQHNWAAQTPGQHGCEARGRFVEKPDAIDTGEPLPDRPGIFPGRGFFSVLFFFFYQEEKKTKKK